MGDEPPLADVINHYVGKAVDLEAKRIDVVSRIMEDVEKEILPEISHLLPIR